MRTRGRWQPYIKRDTGTGIAQMFQDSRLDRASTSEPWQGEKVIGGG